MMKVLVLVLLLLILPERVIAARMYRCGSVAGVRIQDRPCTVRVPRRPSAPLDIRASPTIEAMNIEPPRAAFRSNGYAKILEPAFHKINSLDGLWSGRVEGNGLINLELQIVRHGVLESRRYMGNIELDNTSSGFKFRSVMPRGPGWGWKVVAFTQ